MNEKKSNSFYIISGIIILIIIALVVILVVKPFEKKSEDKNKNEPETNNKEENKKDEEKKFPEFYCENFKSNGPIAKGNILEIFTPGVEGPYTPEKIDTLVKGTYYYAENASHDKFTYSATNFTQSLNNTNTDPFYMDDDIYLYPDGDDGLDQRMGLTQITFKYRKPNAGWSDETESFNSKQLFDSGLFAIEFQSDVLIGDGVYSLDYKSDLEKIISKAGEPSRILGYEYTETKEKYKFYSYYLAWDYEGYSVLIPVTETGYEGDEETSLEKTTSAYPMYFPAASMKIEEEYWNW